LMLLLLLLFLIKNRFKERAMKMPPKKNLRVRQNIPKVRQIMRKTSYTPGEKNLKNENPIKRSVPYRFIIIIINAITTTFLTCNIPYKITNSCIFI